MDTWTMGMISICFDLGIETLFSSKDIDIKFRKDKMPFLSRDRDAFLFKNLLKNQRYEARMGFPAPDQEDFTSRG